MMLTSGSGERASAGVGPQLEGVVGLVLHDPGVAAFVGACVVLVGAVGVGEALELAQPFHERVVVLGGGLLGDEAVDDLVEERCRAWVGSNTADGAHRGCGDGAGLVGHGDRGQDVQCPGGAEPNEGFGTG